MVGFRPAGEKPTTTGRYYRDPLSSLTRSAALASGGWQARGDRLILRDGPGKLANAVAWYRDAVEQYGSLLVGHAFGHARLRLDGWPNSTAVGAKGLERQVQREQLVALPGALPVLVPHLAGKQIVQRVVAIGQRQHIHRQADRDRLAMRANVHQAQQPIVLPGAQHRKDLRAIAGHGVIVCRAVAQARLIRPHAQQLRHKQLIALLLPRPDHRHKAAYHHSGQQHPADTRAAHAIGQRVHQPGLVALGEAGAPRAGQQRPRRDRPAIRPARTGVTRFIGHMQKHMVGQLVQRHIQALGPDRPAELADQGGVRRHLGERMAQPLDHPHHADAAGPGVVGQAPRPVGQPRARRDHPIAVEVVIAQPIDRPAQHMILERAIRPIETDDRRLARRVDDMPGLVVAEPLGVRIEIARIGGTAAQRQIEHDAHVVAVRGGHKHR